MALSDFAPNTAILKSPSNWFFVAFCMVTLTFLIHILNSQGNK